MKKIYFVIALAAMVAGVTVTSCKSKKAVSVTDNKDMKKKFNEQAEVEITFPCSPVDYQSTKDLIRATGQGWSMDMQMAKDYASTAALEALGAKIETSIKAVVNNYRNSRQLNMGEQMERKLEGFLKQEINQVISGYNVPCEKYTKDPQTKNFNCYIAVELGKNNVNLKSIHKRLTEDDVIRVDYDYEKFKKDTEEDFAKMK